MTLYVRVFITIYYQLYKVTSEQDHFLYLSSFMERSSFGSRWLSREKWVTLALCCDWLFADDVTHSCARAPQTQDQVWVDRESWWSASWYRQSRIGVVWFCQLKTYITLNLLIYRHGTGYYGCLLKMWSVESKLFTVGVSSGTGLGIPGLTRSIVTFNFL